MINFELPYIPDRGKKPRATGITMMMDKGLSIRQAEDLIEVCTDYIDLIKLGFGTSMLTPRLKEKIKLYESADIRVYLGGTLFEAFYIRNRLDDYQRLLDELQLSTLEISDGSMVIPHEDKIDIIRKLSKERTVLSEVGAKMKGVIIPPEKWVENMKTELNAGSWKVIGEARESGTVGIYNNDGTVNTDLIDQIAEHVNLENIIWEAPVGKQQAWFIKHFGANVNLGNISPFDIIPLETLRRGIRGDTFFEFLPDEYQSLKIK